MDIERHKLLLYVNECSAAFSSEPDGRSTPKCAVELLEKACEDMFVNYGISGALKIYIANCKSEENFAAFVLFLVQKLKSEQPYWMTMRVLTCLNGVLSTKVMRNLDYKDSLIDLITKDWNPIVCAFFETELCSRGNFESGCHGNCDQNDVCMFEIIRLWKKLVKQILRSDKSNKFDVLKKISQNNDKVWNVMIKLQHALFRNNILKLFNCLLPYGELLSQCSSNIHSLFRQTAENLFKFFHQSGFNRIPVGPDGGFTGRTADVASYDKTQLRLTILLVLKTTAIVTREDILNESKIEDSIHCLCELDTFIKSSFMSIDNKSLQDHDDWILEMFEDQDDMWIESLLALLDIYNRVSASGKLDSSPEQFQTWINPHRQFIIFLKATEYDDSVLIDLLSSPETCFLLYFTRYLKCMRKEWTLFARTSKQITVNKIVKPGLKTETVNNLGNKNVLLNAQEEENPQISSCGLTLLGLYESDEDSDEIISPLIENDDSNEIISPVIEIDDCNKCVSLDFKSERIAIRRDTDILCNDSESIYEDSSKVIFHDKKCDKDVSYPGKADNITNNTIQENCKVVPFVNSMEVCQEHRESAVISPDKRQLKSDLTNQIFAFNKEEKITNPKINMKNNYIKICSRETLCKLDQNAVLNESAKSGFYCEDKLMEDVISCIIRVRLKICKLWRSDLFPYNPDPLISNIEEVEDLYEKDNCF